MPRALRNGIPETSCLGSHCISSQLGVPDVAGYYRADTFQTDTCLGYQMKRAQASLRGLLETAFEAEKLNFPQWTVLVRIRDGARTGAELARSLNYDTGSLTRLIDQLQKLGLLVRKRSKRDRREHELVLTPAGRAMVKALTPHVVNIHNRVLSGFSRQEVETFLRMLGRIVEGIDAVNAHAEPVPPARRLRV